MKRIFLLMSALLLLGGCVSNPPHIDYDPAANFTDYRSFAFISNHPLVRAKGGGTTSPLLEERLMRATTRTLEMKGLRFSENRAQADIQVAFTVGSREKISATSYPPPYYPHYGYWGRGWGSPYYMGMSQMDVRQYTEGILAIDIFDVKTRKPVWHGKATRQITSKMINNPDETVNEIVNDILAGFPPSGDNKPGGY